MTIETPITCINDTYTDHERERYLKLIKEFPQVGSSYTIRKVVKSKNLQYYLELNEFPAGVSFHYSRFTDVPENVLNWEDVNEIYNHEINKLNQSN